MPAKKYFNNRTLYERTNEIIKNFLAKKNKKVKLLPKLNV